MSNENATPHGRASITSTPHLSVLDESRGRLRIDGSWLRSLPQRGEGRRGLPVRVTAAHIDHLSADCNPALRALAASGSVLIGAPRPGMFTTPTEPGTPFEWEVASVRARRHGHCDDGTTVSALLCTNRPERVDFILTQIARQQHRPLQVVLVTHGFELGRPPRQTGALLADAGVQLQVVAAPAAMVFGAALSLGARRCDGAVVVKFDDDDYYGPWHLTDLLAARAHSGAQVVGKALQYLYIEALNTSVRMDGSSSVSSPERYDSWVCGGTIAVDHRLGDEIGWFDAVPRAVDRNILHKAGAADARLYRTHGLGYLYVRHGKGHTYDTSWAKYLRQNTEQRSGIWAHDEFGTGNLKPAQTTESA